MVDSGTEEVVVVGGRVVLVAGEESVVDVDSARVVTGAVMVGVGARESSGSKSAHEAPLTSNANQAGPRMWR